MSFENVFSRLQYTEGVKCWEEVQALTSWLLSEDYRRTTIHGLKSQVITKISNSSSKNVTRIFSCLVDGSLVGFKNEAESDGNPIIFLANAMEIP